MAVQFYVEQSNSAYKSGIADAEIHAGEIVANGGAGVVLADAQNALEDIDGLALFSEEFMVGEDEDAVVDEVYASGDRVKYAPLGDTLRGYGRTPEDNGQTAPSISHETVVGLIDTSDTNAPAGSAGRLVEEGYTADADGDSTSTTFNRSNGNFVALGVAYRPGKQNNDTVTAFDTVVRVSFFEPRT